MSPLESSRHSVSHVTRPAGALSPPPLRQSLAELFEVKSRVIPEQLVPDEASRRDFVYRLGGAIAALKGRAEWYRFSRIGPTAEYVQSMAKQLTDTALDLFQAVRREGSAPNEAESRLERAKQRLLGQNSLRTVEGIMGKMFIAPEAYRVLGVEVMRFRGLSDDIVATLTSPCPFYRGYQVRQTHYLSYLPDEIDGAPFSLRELERRVEGRRQRGEWSPRLQMRKKFNPKGDFYSESVPHGGWVLSLAIEPNALRGLSLEAQVTQLQDWPQYRTASALSFLTPLILREEHRGMRAKQDTPVWCDDLDHWGWPVHIAVKDDQIVLDSSIHPQEGALNLSRALERRLL